MSPSTTHSLPTDGGARNPLARAAVRRSVRGALGYGALIVAAFMGAFLGSQTASAQPATPAPAATAASPSASPEARALDASAEDAAPHDAQPHDAQPHDAQPHDAQPHDAQPTLRPPQPEDEFAALNDPEVEALDAQAKSTLLEGAEDLGFIPAWIAPAVADASRDQALLDRAPDGWALSGQVRRAPSGLLLRVSLIAPGETILRVLQQGVTADSLEVTSLKMLRDLHRSTVTQRRSANPTAAPLEPAPREADGRAYLAVTGALVGGYVGFSMEHIAGSSDDRLIYPLMTLGAGVGVGASLVAADEWRVTTGEAWYLSAATLWSTSAALMIATGSDLDEPSHRHAYGLLGTAAGLSLGTLAVSTSEIGQGGALLTHSGAIFGGVFGALTERLVEPKIDERPALGLGTGLAVGTLTAGLLATQWQDPPPTRLVYIDLSAFLGALTGAAGASPALVGDDVTETETRIWISSVLGGTLLGGALGYVLTDGTNGADGTNAAGEHDDTAVSLRVRPNLSRADFGQTHGPKPWTIGLTGSW